MKSNEIKGLEELSIKQICIDMRKYAPDDTFCFDEECNKDIDSEEPFESYDDQYYLEELVKLFMYDEIGVCGCGSPDEIEKLVRDVLLIQHNKIEFEEDYNTTEAKRKELYGDTEFGYIAFEFILKILDDKEFLEHGGSILNAWLTDKGKHCLFVLNMIIEEDNE